MKHLAVWLSFAALPLATVGTALAAGPDAFVAGSASSVHYSNDGRDSEDGYRLTGLASGAYNFTPMIGAQGDVVLNFEHVDEGEEARLFDGAGHLFYRDPEKFLVGIIGQLGHDTISFDGVEEVTRSRSYAGLEAQGFFNNITVYGQAGVVWSDVDSGFDSSGKGWFATGEVRFYATPNFKVNVHAGISKVTPDGAPSDDFATNNVNLGIGAEYRLDNSPLSLFAGIDNWHETADFDDFEEDVLRVTVGIKGSFGSETQLDRDRNGASLKPLDETLANFFQAVR